MTVTNSLLVPSKYVENAQTTQYTSTNATTLIDKCTVTNVTGVAATLSINLVNTGSAAGASNLFISTKTIQPSETYSCPEIVGHVLRNGDFISAIAGTASALAFRVSGRQIS